MRFVCRHRVAPVLSISTDHRPAIFELCFRARIKKHAPARRPNLDKRALQDRNVSAAFEAEISNTLGERDPEQLASEDLSSIIRAAPVAAAEKVLLPKTVRRKYPDEFSPETIELITQKRAAWKTL